MDELFRECGPDAAPVIPLMRHESASKSMSKPGDLSDAPGASDGEDGEGEGVRFHCSAKISQGGAVRPDGGRVPVPARWMSMYRRVYNKKIELMAL